MRIIGWVSGMIFRATWWLLCHVWALIVVMVVIWNYLGPTIPLAILDGNLALMQFVTGAIAHLGSYMWDWAAYFSAPYDLLNQVVGGIKKLTAAHEVDLPFFGKRTFSLGQNAELIGRIVAEGVPLYFELKLVRFIDWCVTAPERFRAWRQRRREKRDVLQITQSSNIRQFRRKAG